MVRCGVWRCHTRMPARHRRREALLNRYRVGVAFFTIGLLAPFGATAISRARQQQGTAGQATSGQPSSAQSSPGQGTSASGGAASAPCQSAPSATQQSATVPPGSAMHCITVNFDYDFTKTPACSAKVKTACIQTFDVYDISGDKPYLLFSVPAPPEAHGTVKGISATSPRMLFAVGKHRIGVSARMASGQKSPPRDCKVVIEIKADQAPAPPASQ
jgi:hypothetical protein